LATVGQSLLDNGSIALEARTADAAAAGARGRADLLRGHSCRKVNTHAGVAGNRHRMAKRIPVQLVVVLQQPQGVGNIDDRKLVGANSDCE
jgi:hypothetical protein